MEKTGKPVVEYSHIPGSYPQVGRGTYILPHNHPAEDRVSNTGPAITSPVIWVGDNGDFETKNTIYVLRKQ